MSELLNIQHYKRDTMMMSDAFYGINAKRLCYKLNSWKRLNYISLFIAMNVFVYVHASRLIKNWPPNFCI